MGLVFRPMTAAEIAAKDRRQADARARLSANDGDGAWQGYGIGVLAGLNLNSVDVVRALWKAGYVIVRLDMVSDEAVEELGDG